jgi:hypothetical protein
MLRNLDGWDVALLAMAGYIAVVGLVRLMIGWRSKYLEAMRREIEQPSIRSTGGPAAPSRKAA